MLVFFDDGGQRFGQLNVGLWTSRESQKQEGQKSADEQISYGWQKVIFFQWTQPPMIFYIINPRRYLPGAIKKYDAIGEENRKSPQSSRRKE